METITLERTGRTRATKWEVWTYDVWGNTRDGYEINDRCCVAREYDIVEHEELHPNNTRDATQGSFPVWNVSDDDIRDALGVQSDVAIDVDGNEDTLYVNAVEDGYPLGELLRVEDE